jgi:hypothetical protein
MGRMPALPPDYGFGTHAIHAGEADDAHNAPP